MKRLIETIRKWRAFRHERRQRIESARRQAMLLSLGGAVTLPRNQR